MESNPASLHLKHICRFCLSDAEPLNSIYERNHNRSIRLPLQLQIMSCVAIEVYAEDEMPQVICNICRWNLDHFYKFKSQCKKADEALKDYLLSGKLLKPFSPISINLPTEIGNKRPAKSTSQNEVSEKQCTSDDNSKDTRERCEIRLREKEKETESQNEDCPLSERLSKSILPISINPPTEIGNKRPAKSTSQNEVSEKQCTSDDNSRDTRERRENRLREKEKEREPQNEDYPLSERLPKPIRPLPINPPTEIGNKRPVKSTSQNEISEKQCTSDDNSRDTSRERREIRLREKEKEREPQNEDCPLSERLPKPIRPIPINPPTEIGNKRPAKSRSQNEVSKKQRTSDDDRDTRERHENSKRKKERERESQNEEQNASEQHLHEEEQNRSSKSEASNINENGEQEPAEIRVHACDQCERTFPLRQALLLHVERTHIRARNYKCNDCEKTFFNKHDLAKHFSIHSEEKPFSCLICKKQFRRLTTLQRHRKDMHKNEPHYACLDCDSEFFTTKELEEHKNSAHNTEKRFCCNICNKRFLYKQGLQRHEMLHNKEKKFTCDYCKESFHTCSKLIRHLSIHAGSRPYMCKLCPNRYLLSHHLTRHVRTRHSTEKYHKKYGRKSLKINQLTRTKRTYMGLTCDICQESCRNRADYVVHTKQHIEAGEKTSLDSSQPNTKKNLRSKSNEKEEKEKDQHSNRNDEHKSPEKEKEQNREDKREKSKKQEKEKPNVMYVRSKHGSMVKITTFPPIERIHDIQEPKAISKRTKQTTSIDSSSQSSSEDDLTSSQIEKTPKSGHVDDTETQAQKIVTSVYKKRKTSFHSSSEESCEDNDETETLVSTPKIVDETETLASTPKIVKVRKIKRIIVRKGKPARRSNEETPTSTSSIKDGDSSLNGTPGSRKVTRVVLSRIIRKNDITHKVIMNPDGTTIDSAEPTKLPTGNVVKRIVRKLPLDKNQNLVQALLQSAKQRQETEGTSASSSNDTLKSSDASKKKQSITRGQETQEETEAVGEEEIIDVETIGEGEIVDIKTIGDVAEIVEIEN